MDRRNRVAATCSVCGRRVLPRAGVCEKRGASTRVRHETCAPPEPAPAPSVRRGRIVEPFVLPSFGRHLAGVPARRAAVAALVVMVALGAVALAWRAGASDSEPIDAGPGPEAPPALVPYDTLADVAAPTTAPNTVAPTSAVPETAAPTTAAPAPRPTRVAVTVAAVTTLAPEPPPPPPPASTSPPTTAAPPARPVTTLPPERAASCDEDDRRGRCRDRDEKDERSGRDERRDDDDDDEGRGRDDD